ncbi:MAG: pirin family protein [Labilithrix sp.]
MPPPAESAILEMLPLGFPWVTADPFLFCVHHDDKYPAGNDKLGPEASLAGRRLGMDFEGKDGWRMYHGETVPGFPQHPHRGFETVTILRSGFIDHSDSLGATARFGPGDVQWLTAGQGIVHCEMFPLLSKEKPNPLELFQIWLNLPSEDKMVTPHFSMLWNKDIPRVKADGAEVMVIAGPLADAVPAKAPPKSWASRADTGVAIWSIVIEPGKKWTMPPASDARVTRTLYFFRGTSLAINGEKLTEHAAIVVRNDLPLELEAGEQRVDILMLQGRPIAEPVVQHGPFVMNTRAEIQQAISDYQRTKYGGWPWPSDDPVHPREETRFAKHADGRVERVD